MIKIVGFEYEIISFRIIKKLNCHSKCCFRVNIYDSPKEDFLNRLGQQLIVEDGECLFFGEISEISAEKFFDHSEIIVKAFSYSIHLDLKPQKKIFQNPDKTLKSIIDFTKKDSGFEAFCSVEDKIINPVLQAEETDFKFIVRMAHSCGKQVLVNDNRKNKTPQLLITDFSEESVFEINQEPEQLSYRSINITNKEGKQERTEIIEIIVRELYISLGQRVKINGNIRYTSEVNIFWENGATKCRYVLYELDKIPYWKSYPFPEHILLRAITQNNSDKEFRGRIQVRFECDYLDVEPDKQMWIPYQTPYFAGEGGFIFLPDQGDIVEVVYSNNSFSAHEILGELPLKEDFQNVKNKYIANVFKKRICFSEDQLEITSDDNTLVLSEHAISINVKDAKLSVEDDKIILRAGKNEICIDSYININGSELKIDTNKVNITASKDVCIKGDKIHLK